MSTPESGIDLPKELEELLLPMTPVAFADHFPRGHIQRDEERGRANTDIIRSVAPRLAGRHRQQGLRAVQGLHLALLINRQDDGVLWRIHVQADDVADLLDGVGIGGEVEIDTRGICTTTSPESNTTGSCRQDRFASPQTDAI
jgi:hypothetical protein